LSRSRKTEPLLDLALRYEYFHNSDPSSSVLLFVGGPSTASAKSAVVFPGSICSIACSLTYCPVYIVRELVSISRMHPAPARNTATPATAPATRAKLRPSNPLFMPLFLLSRGRTAAGAKLT